MALKVFKAYYDARFLEGSGLVVANTESEALGLCLSANDYTKAQYWEFEEIDINVVGADISFLEHCS